MLSVVLHTPQCLRGLRTQIKGRGAPSSCSSIQFLLLRLPDGEWSVSLVSWSDPLTSLSHHSNHFSRNLGWGLPWKR